jgi:outer membrane lipoprotein-sorting protein
MNRFSRYIFALVGLLLISPAIFGATLSSSEILNNAASKLKKAQSVTASFSMSGSASAKGSITVSGNSFFVDTNISKTWCNGTVMTTYNPRTNEATMTSPTAAERNESNPLSYISSWSSDYMTVGSPTSTKSTYTITLKAKKSTAAAKKVIITLASATYYPKKIEATMKSGDKVVINISSVTLGKSKTSSFFTFHSGKYKNATIIDLR